MNLLAQASLIQAWKGYTLMITGQVMYFIKPSHIVRGEEAALVNHGLYRREVDIQGIE